MPSHRSPTRSSKSSKSRKSPDRSKKHKHYRNHNDHEEHDHHHHDHTHHHSNDSHRHRDRSRDKLSVSSRKTESLSRKRHYSPDEESPDRKDDNKKSKVRTKEEKDEEYISRKSDQRRESPKVKEESQKSEPKGLADLLPDEDAADWVLKSRKIEEERLKIEKMKAARKARILDEMDDEIVSQVAGPNKSNINQLYTEEDLKGLKVAHSEKYLKEGHQIIMTLKDKDVLDENEDVLENVNIVDLEKAEKNMDNKLKKNEYRPYDEPEFDEFGILKKKNLLAKYDEEIDGMKKDSFQIGSSSIDREKEAELIREMLRQQAGKISLETPQFKVASEYYTEEEMTKFKKPKKIRAKKKGKRFSEDVIVESSNSDHGSRKNRNSQNVEEVPSTSSSVDKKLIEKRIKVQMDDDLLQSDSEIPDIDLSEIVLEEQEAEEEFRKSLEKAKKLKEKEKEKKEEEERIAKLIAEREASIKKEQEDDYSDIASTSQGRSTIVLNATAEFCRNLGDISTIKEEYEDEDELMDFEKDLLDDRRSNEILDEKSPEQPIRGTWNEVDMEASVASFDSVEIADPSQPILEEEPDVSHGVAAALKVAMKKGYLDKEPRKPIAGSRHSSLQAQNYTIEEKFYDEEKLGRRGDRYNGPLSDFKEKDSYKPDVKLDYVDEKGRLLNQKEAFRVLSHKFHGKGPGKNKIDKRMKKLDQEGVSISQIFVIHSN